MAKSVKFKMVFISLQVVYQTNDKSLHIMEFPYYPQIDDFEAVKVRAIATIGADGKPIKFVKGKKEVYNYEIPLSDIVESFGTIAKCHQTAK